MILAVACLVDLQNRDAEHPDAEKYHHWKKLVSTPFYEIWYLLVFSDKKAAGYAWGLMGLTAKLAQSVSWFDSV